MRGVFLHLDMWEDLTARMSAEGSQSEYNKKVQAADLFILLVYTKVGMYTAEAFEKAFGQFQYRQKPFILTYFKTPGNVATDPSLEVFHQKLRELKHFHSPFKDADDLWNQFSKELDRLELENFTEFRHAGVSNQTAVSGDGNIIIQGNTGVSVNIQTMPANQQDAGKIDKDGKVDKAGFL